MKLGLHLRYPPTRPHPTAARTAGAPPFGGASFGITASFPSRTAAALPHVHGLSPARSTTAAPPRPDPIGRRWTQPHHRAGCAEQGEDRTVPVFTVDSLDEGGAQLCPCGIATATPQHFTVASRPTSTCPPRSSPPEPSGAGAHRTRPISARFEPVALEGRTDAGSSRTPLRHARRTRTIWQYWHVPALSGLLPPSPAPPGSGCPQLHRPAATGQRRRSLTSTRIVSASRRTAAAGQPAREASTTAAGAGVRPGRGGH